MMDTNVIIKREDILHLHSLDCRDTGEIKKLQGSLDGI